MSTLIRKYLLKKVSDIGQTHKMNFNFFFKNVRKQKKYAGYIQDNGKM